METIEVREISDFNTVSYLLYKGLKVKGTRTEVRNGKRRVYFQFEDSRQLEEARLDMANLGPEECHGLRMLKAIEDAKALLYQ